MFPLVKIDTCETENFLEISEIFISMQMSTFTSYSYYVLLNFYSDYLVCSMSTVM